MSLSGARKDELRRWIPAFAGMTINFAMGREPRSRHPGMSLAGIQLVRRLTNSKDRKPSPARCRFQRLERARFLVFDLQYYVRVVTSEKRHVALKVPQVDGVRVLASPSTHRLRAVVHHRGAIVF
jgi:hypothetical protein